MSKSNQYWNEALGYAHWITLDPNPKSLEDFEEYIFRINDTIETIHIRALLKRIPDNDPILFDNIKECIARETQIKKPSINKIWREIQSSKKREELSNTSVISKKKKGEKKSRKKVLTPERIQECEEWLNLPDKQKYDFIRDIFGFYIVGDIALQQALTIFILKLGDVLSKELVSKVDFHGDPSSGKSYPCNIIIKLFPEECYISLFNASPKALLYDSSFNEDVKFIYLKELTKDNKSMVELLKALYDGDVNYIVTHYEEMDVEKFQKHRTGLLTTYSFEYTQRDAIDRAWVFIPDQTHKQNKLVINFRLERRKNRIQYDVGEKKLLKKIELIKDVIRVLREKTNVIVQIPYNNMIEPLFSKEILRVRRDIDKLPDIIEVLAMLNQNNRLNIKFDGKKYIFASYEDLEFALENALELFIEISQNVDGVQKDILDFMEYSTIESKEEYTPLTRSKETTPKEVDKIYSLREIFEEVSQGRSIHKNTVRNKLEGLGANNYINIIREGKGKPLKYKKLKDYEIPTFPIKQYKEEIQALVEQNYIFWRDLTPETIGEEEEV